LQHSPSVELSVKNYGIRLLSDSLTIARCDSTMGLLS